MHFLCHAEHLDEFVKLVGENLIEDVLVPNATWQAGQANSKIRKGAMVEEKFGEQNCRVII